MSRIVMTLLLFGVACLIGCAKQPEQTIHAAAPATTPSQEQQSAGAAQALTDSQNADTALSQRPIFEWANLVAIGDDIDRVNAAAKLVHYPAVDCYPPNPKGFHTCNTANESGLLTANFDNGTGRLISLHDWEKDPERTNYRLLKGVLTSELGTPKAGSTKLTWHQRDGSIVTLEWLDGAYNLSLQNKNAP